MKKDLKELPPKKVKSGFYLSYLSSLYQTGRSLILQNGPIDLTVSSHIRTAEDFKTSCGNQNATVGLGAVFWARNEKERVGGDFCISRLGDWNRSTTRNYNRTGTKRLQIGRSALK